MSRRDELAKKTVQVIDGDGEQREISYHEIALHRAAHCARARREFLENRLPSQLATILVQEGSATIDENVALHQALDYELFFDDPGLCEDDALRWLEKMGLRLTPEMQADYDLWLADVYPPHVGRGSARVSPEWRDYRAVRAAYDAQQGYGWWNIKPVWLEKLGYEPQKSHSTKRSSRTSARRKA